MRELPVRCSVAAVVRRRPGDAEFLIVQRPFDDESLPGEWGLPAITLRKGELPEDGIRRIGREKLGARIRPAGLVGADATTRDRYRLVLLDIEAVLEEGDPDPAAASTDATRYIAAQWTDSLAALRPAAEQGSLCCRILLREGQAG